MIGIDLGSNTLRAVQINCKTGETVAIYEEIVRTADGLVDTGIIGEEAKERIIDAIREAKKHIDFATDRYRAVTTEAIRRAANRDEILSHIKKKTGILFEVISGREEAALTLLAVKQRLKMLFPAYGEKPFLLADIGGGSTELIFSYQSSVLSKSFPVGIVTVSQSHQALEEIREALPSLMIDMQHYCDEVFSRHGKTDTFVATAGTPTTIAAMKLGQNYATYDPERVNGTSLSIDDLDSALHHLLSISPQEREVAVGVGRSDLIAAGILIFRQLFVIAGMQECLVIDDGLREGVALKMCRELTGEVSSSIRK